MADDQTTAKPAASVIIPTWDGAALLRETLVSLRLQSVREHEVIVVDNGSTDGTFSMLESFPEVRQIRLGENRGFAAAANAGVREAVSDVIVLLNNDATAEPGWLEALLAALAAHPEIGSCASRMLMHDRPDLIDSAGDRLGVFASNIGHGVPDGAAFSRPRHVLSACAGAAAYRRTALEVAGLFDERFFAYLEDVDLGVRLQLAGYRCLYVPDAVVRHRGSATAARVPGFKYHLLMRNSLMLFFQYMPVRRMVFWSWLVFGWPLAWAVVQRVRPGLVWRVYAEFARELRTIIGIRIRVGRKGARLLAPLLSSPLSVQRRRRTTQTSSSTSQRLVRALRVG